MAFVEAAQEPRHATALMTDFVRILRVRFPPKDSTLFHRHRIDSFYIDLVNATLLNEMQGEEAVQHVAHFGGTSYKKHSVAPYIHRITCLSEEADWFCLDGELLNRPPTAAAHAIEHSAHTLVLEGDRVRIYRIALEPGQSTEDLEYGFYGVFVSLCQGEVAGHGAQSLGDVFEVCDLFGHSAVDWLLHTIRKEII